MPGSLGRRCAAEALGTALLVVFGPGSVVAALTVGGGELDYAGLGVVGLSFGIVVAVVVYALGTTSGAHINPAVTAALAVAGRFPWREVGPYVGAQLAGSVAGGLVVVAAFGRGAVELGAVGGVAFSPGVGYGQAVLVEALGTFFLMTAIMGLAVDRRAPAGWAGLVIGLSVTSIVVVLGPLTGAAVNPARAFGPLTTAGLLGGDVAWSQLPAYVVGSVVGAVAAALAYDGIARPRDADDLGEPAQGAQGDVLGEQAT